MDTLKKWQIIKIECTKDKSDNRVVLAHWVFTVSFESAEVSSYGVINLENINNPVYIPYSELTENDVIYWVKEALGEKVNAMELELDKQITEKLTPSVVILPLPWNN
jgi:hypothetical protein